jgi:multicomponent Na+:H+ antiporter subunit D
MIGNLPPCTILFAGAILVPLLRGRAQSVFMLLLPVLSFIHLLGLPEGASWTLTLFSHEVTLVHIDRLSLLFGYLFHIAALIGLIFSLHVRDNVQHASALAYAGSALGAVFAGDMITLFVFWELLAATSVFLIWARRTDRSYAAGMRYLIIQVGSGVLLLAGVILHVRQTGSVEFVHMELDSWGHGLIFIAFGIKCAFPFLHNWLTDAYPEATPTGAVFLTSFTTKVAVYALARGFSGAELHGVPILVYIGAAMTAFPIFFAVIENDLRKVLAYSLNNQLGFMVVGIGIGTELSLNGTVAHAFCHVLYKSLLFMSMGAVLYRTGTIKASELGGLYKSMPFTAVCCIIGAASISAFPLFSGFVSKSMVMGAVIEEGHDFVWLILLFASAGVFHHAGIKIPFFAFFSHDSGIRCEEAPRNMLTAMTVAAVLCVGIGCFPGVLYGLLPYEVDYVPYTLGHVITQTQILFFSALAFTWLKLIGLYPPELRSVNLDADWFYRRLGVNLYRRAARGVARVFGGLEQAAGAQWGALQTYFVRLLGPHGVLSRTHTTSSMALWVAVLLSVILIFYYFF